MPLPCGSPPKPPPVSPSPSSTFKPPSPPRRLRGCTFIFCLARRPLTDSGVDRGSADAHTSFIVTTPMRNVGTPPPAPRAPLPLHVGPHCGGPRMCATRHFVPLALPLAAILLLAFAASEAQAACPHDPNNGNVPPCTAANSQDAPVTVSNGSRVPL